MPKPDYDIFSLLKSNAAILYPQYSAHTLHPTIARIYLRGRSMYYVALFTLLPSIPHTSATVAANAGTPPGLLGSMPRLLATGPPKETVCEALEAMLELFLAKDIAAEVNLQAARSVKVERREVEQTGYTFEWPETDINDEHQAGMDGQYGERPPAYEES